MVEINDYDFSIKLVTHLFQKGVNTYWLSLQLWIKFRILQLLGLLRYLYNSCIGNITGIIFLFLANFHLEQ